MIEVRYKQKIIVSKVHLADNFIDRLMGYMFRRKPHVEGILFQPAISIHTFFMNFPLDVVFLDRKLKVLKVYRNLMPWRHTWFYFKAQRTLEIPAGHLPEEIREGDILEIYNV